MNISESSQRESGAGKLIKYSHIFGISTIAKSGWSALDSVLITVVENLVCLCKTSVEFLPVLISIPYNLIPLKTKLEHRVRVTVPVIKLY